MSAAHAPDLARRAFLRGRTQREPVLRPPWAQPEAAFLEACTTCDACVLACPESVLVTGAGALPEFDPALGECTFCGICSDACTPGALDRALSAAPWRWVAAMDDACLSSQGVVCVSCQDICPERAISMPLVPGGKRMPSVATAQCTGCGACVAVCPTSAVHLALPDKESSNA